jgi:hypothetical protein
MFETLSKSLCVTDGQTQATEFGYAQLPSAVVQMELAAPATITVS